MAAPVIARSRPLRLGTGLALALLLAACGSSKPVGSGSGSGAGASVCGKPLPATTPLLIANSGRKLMPLGRLTAVGNFPTGGRLSPDGRFYWSVSAGHGRADVQIVEVSSGRVTQVLPLPGAYGQMVFAPDGKTAYVSGEPKGSSTPSGPTMGDEGDVIHVYRVDPASGLATEQKPIGLPATQGGSARSQSFPPSTTNLPSFPVGLAITPDGKTLVAALYNADKAALIDTASGGVTIVDVGAYPYAVGFERSGRYAYVSNAFDGTLSKIDVGAAKVVKTIAGLGGPEGAYGVPADHNSHPQFVLADPKRDLLYVAVTNRDGVAVVDTASDTVTRFISLRRPEGYGSQPVSLALAPDGGTLYAANAGENAIVSIALADRADGSARQYEVIGKIPTADYTSDVALTPDGCTLVWAAARGAGAGPNPGYGGPPPARVNNDSSKGPYPSYVPDMLVGRVGVLPMPTDAAFAAMSTVVDTAQRPENSQAAPADTPVVGADGGPSDKIKYVFFVVKENRTYDQIFGSDPRGDGDPSLEVLGDNGEALGPHQPGTATPGSGVTPNQHALSRMFVLLDRFFENSEVSVDGHAITTGAYASNYTLKTMHADYSNRGRPANQEGVYPVSFPPRDFLFDQLVSQGITFHNYGELAGGAAPLISDDGRSTYLQVLANSDNVAYADNVFIGCVTNTASQLLIPNTPDCAFDAGLGASPPLALSRINQFNLTFGAQLLAGAVPHFNYLIMPSDHTNGTTPGGRDPLAMCADNDLGVGQLVDIVSHSSIWPQSVIFVVEDDSQDGADHVDAHRAPAFVIGPWVKHGGQVVHTRYDQLSVIRTIELILGLQPLSVFDAVATPMYDAFAATPDNTPYTAILPTQDIQAVNPANAANAALSAHMPFDRLDAVPQEISDRILWQRVHGAGSPPPPPGPNASRLEQRRAQVAMDAYRHGRDVRAALQALGDDD
ncbi:MAG TPA: alkaline phosphatase family protein [Nevskia sp.]|nr:alkaline phosphatase family protein [Nevskia sp.]